MNPAELSLAALVVALAVSCVSRVNIGFLSLVLAWLVGVYGNGLRIEDVLAGFPASLFVTLAGVTLLFAQAQTNCTLERVARQAVRLCGGRAGLLPLLFFALSAALSSIGPGNIAATALMAPLGMAAAGRHGVSPFVMAVMIATGASAGSLSPIAPTGVIVNALLTRLGLPDARWTIYADNLTAHAAVALGGYLLLRGWKAGVHMASPAAVAALVSGDGSRPGVGAPGAAVVPTETSVEEVPAADVPEDAKLEPRHVLTLATIAVIVGATIAFGVNVGLAALAGALVLTLARVADEGAAIRAMPWSVILMVTGVTVLVALLERTGGIDLFAAFLGRLTTPATATAVAAFVTGLISIYSSTTGVVLPALLPTVPDLVAHVGGGVDPMALVSAMTVGGHLVDVSPLSTLGALCLAAAPPGTDSRRLFNQLLAWGLSMTVVGAVVCWMMF